MSEREGRRARYWDAMYDNRGSVDPIRRVMAVADQEQAALRAEVEMAGEFVQANAELGEALVEARATIARLDEDVATWISRAVDAEAELTHVTQNRVRQANALIAERDQALATIERVKALHRNEWDDNTSAPIRCVHDGKPWPCPTIRALDAPEPATNAAERPADTPEPPGPDAAPWKAAQPTPVPPGFGSWIGSGQLIAHDPPKANRGETL